MLTNKNHILSWVLCFVLLFSSSFTVVHAEEGNTDTPEETEEILTEEVAETQEEAEPEEETEPEKEAESEEETEPAVVEETEENAKEYAVSREELNQAKARYEKAAAAYSQAQLNKDNADSAAAAAKNTLDEKEANMNALKDAADNAQAAYNTALGEYQNAQSEVTQLTASLNTAEQTVTAALTAKQNAETEYQNALEQLEDAEGELAEAETQLETAQAEKEAAEEELEAARAAAAGSSEQYASLSAQLTEAEAAVAQAQAQIDKGSYGFFEAQGATEAMEILDYMMSDAIEESRQIKLGDEHDPSNLELMKVSIEMIKTGNELRTTDNNFPDLDPLQVSNSMMAIAQANAAHSADPYDGSVNHWSNVDGGLGAYKKKWDTGENLAWGYKLPTHKENSGYVENTNILKSEMSAYSGWYTSEKKTFDEGGDGQTGHYANIVDSNYELTGFAISYDSNIRTCYAQEFNWGEYYTAYNPRTGTYRQVKNSQHPDDMTLYTADEYYNIFMEYYNEVNDNLSEAVSEKERIEAELAALGNNERIEQAEAALAEKENALTEAQTVYNQKKEAAETADQLANEALLTVSEKTDEYNEAVAARNEISEQLTDAQTRLQQAQINLQNAEAGLGAVTVYQNAVNEYEQALSAYNNAAAAQSSAAEEYAQAKAEYEAAKAAYEALLGSVVHVTSVSIMPAKAELIAGDSMKFELEVLPGNADFQGVTWSSSNENVAMTDQEGNIYARTPGTTIITVVNEDDGNLSASAEITVKTVSSVEKVSITVPSGTAPVLPETVNVGFDNGTSGVLAVSWDTVDAKLYRKREGGQFSVSGTVEKTGLKASAEIEVLPAEIIEIEELTPLETFVGQLPVEPLPEEVTVRWSNGDVTEEDVTWIEPTAELFNRPATFFVLGHVYDTQGNSHEVFLTINAKAVEITDIQLDYSYAKVNYYIGEELDVRHLILTLAYSDGSVGICPVNEDMVEGFDSSTAGEKTVTVIYEGQRFEYKVTVREKLINKEKCYVTDTDTIKIYEDKDPDFGDAAVHIVYEDGSEKILPLQEDMLGGADLHTVGEHTVSVTAEGEEVAQITIVVRPSLKLKAPKLSYVKGEDTVWLHDGDEAVILSGSSIEISADTGAVVVYTADGSTPAETSAKTGQSIVLTETGTYTLKFMAIQEGHDNSDIVTVNVTVIDDSIWTEDNPGDVSAEDAAEIGYKIPDGLWCAGIPEKTAYTGAKITFSTLRIYDHKTLLTNKKDYTVVYKNNKNAYNYAGDREHFVPAKKDKTPYVKVTGKGNYSGKVYVPFTIEAIDLTDPEQVYIEPEVTLKESKKVQRPMPLIMFAGKKLTTKDVRVSYVDAQGNILTAKKGPKTAGDYVIRIEGKKNFSGTKEVSLKITGSSNARDTAIPLKNALTVTAADEVYDGQAKTNALVTCKEGYILTEGKDYTVTYRKNVKVGTASVIVQGQGKYSGTVKKTFRITPLAMDAGNGFVLEAADQISYQKNGAKPAVTVRWNDRILKKGTDYTVKYSGNTQLGDTGMITVTGKGCFTGTLTKNFRVDTKDLSQVTVTVLDKVQTKKAYSSPTLKDTNGKVLKAGTDYIKPSGEDYVYVNDTYVTNRKNYVLRYAGSTVQAEDIPDAGSLIKVRITGKGNYTGETEAIYRIIEKQYNIASAKVQFVNSEGKTVKKLTKEYTGNPVTLQKSELILTRKVKVNGKSVTEVIDPSEYEIVSYTNNTKKGTAKVEIIGTGENFSGRKIVTFRIGTRKMSNYWEGVKIFFAKMF